MKWIKATVVAWMAVMAVVVGVYLFGQRDAVIPENTLVIRNQAELDQAVKDQIAGYVKFLEGDKRNQ